jgi:predicted PurR-regulated permease PerM
MNPYQKNLVFFLVAILVFFLSAPARASDGFTQKDRELLITLRVKVEEIDKRFEQIDKRFEQLEKRFEQIDKRFEQIDKRFDQMMTFLWMIVGIFTAITASTIGFAIWDRRSMIRPFESKVKELEEGKIDKVISSLKTLAETDAKVAEILRRHNLL